MRNQQVTHLTLDLIHLPTFFPIVSHSDEIDIYRLNNHQL
jgi:hypothetical protein